MAKNVCILSWRRRAVFLKMIYALRRVPKLNAEKRISRLWALKKNNPLNILLLDRSTTSWPEQRKINLRVANAQ